MAETKMIIDGKGAILGRLSSRVAKLLLLGREVSILNAQRVLMSGSLQVAKAKYLHRLTQKHKADPNRSPKWPKDPSMLLKRIIRGMLPKKTLRGREALRRLRVYAGVPKEFEGAKPMTFPEFSGESKQKAFTLLSLCKEVGYIG